MNKITFLNWIIMVLMAACQPITAQMPDAQPAQVPGSQAQNAGVENGLSLPPYNWERALRNDKPNPN